MVRSRGRTALSGVDKPTGSHHTGFPNNEQGIPVNNAELAKTVSTRTNVSAKVAETVISSALATIADTLKTGADVRLYGFGSFAVASTAARSGKNPATGEAIQIAASRRVGFKAAKRLKDAVKV